MNTRLAERISDVIGVLRSPLLPGNPQLVEPLRGSLIERRSRAEDGDFGNRWQAIEEVRA